MLNINSQSVSAKFGWLAGFVVVILSLVIVFPAFAHTRVEVGPYQIVVGWENEPVIVGERNALIIEVSESGTAVEGLEGLLNLTVLYGGRSFIGQLAPTDQPGAYAAEIFPTVRGQYEVHLTGQINDVAVDEFLEPEEVLPANVLQFPGTLPDPGSMQAEIDDLAGQVEAARTLAYAGLAAGVIGILVGVIAVFRRRS